MFVIEAIAQPGVSLDQLESAIDAEVARLAGAPPTGEELKRAQNQYETSFVARLQSVAERAQLLNTYQMAVGDPGYADKDLARYRAATPAAVQAVVKGTLDPNARVILRVVPKDAPPDAAKPAAKKGAK
ncbi:MAG: hypothetical protein QM820_05230 [Minicystis sp.]